MKTWHMRQKDFLKNTDHKAKWCIKKEKHIHIHKTNSNTVIELNETGKKWTKLKVTKHEKIYQANNQDFANYNSFW